MRGLAVSHFRTSLCCGRRSCPSECNCWLGYARATCLRKARNSWCRWRGLSAAVTFPVEIFRAANRVEVRAGCSRGCDVRSARVAAAGSVLIVPAPGSVTDEFAVVWERDTEGNGSYLTRLTDRGREVFVARPGLTRYIGASPSGVWAHEAWRIAAHQSRLGVDTDQKTIPYEGSAGSARPYTWTRGATPGRRPSPASTTSAGRRAGWLCCISTGRWSICRRTAIRLRWTGRSSASSARRPATTSGPDRVGTGQCTVPVDAKLVAGGVAASQEVIVDPDVGLHLRRGRRHRADYTSQGQRHRCPCSSSPELRR